MKFTAEELSRQGLTAGNLTTLIGTGKVTKIQCHTPDGKGFTNIDLIDLKI